MSGRGNVRKVAAAVIIICLLAMAGFSGIKLYRLICEYRDNQQAYRAVSETAITDDSLKVDFDELRKINPDVVGWIREKASYTTDVKITAEDRLLILSTCAYEYNGARYIVVCKIFR